MNENQIKSTNTYTSTHSQNRFIAQSVFIVHQHSNVIISRNILNIQSIQSISKSYLNHFYQHLNLEIISIINKKKLHQLEDSNITSHTTTIFWKILQLDKTIIHWNQSIDK